MGEKFIQDQASLEYKKRLKEFMQEVNPKPELNDIKKLKQQYLKAREKQNEPRSVN